MLDSLISCFRACTKNQLFKFVLFFADVACRKRQIITQHWRKSSGHRGLEPANLAAGKELNGNWEVGGFFEVANLNPSPQMAFLRQKQRVSARLNCPHSTVHWCNGCSSNGLQPLVDTKKGLG